ncbi:MAG TPA: DNA translocase FtsK [Gammaproteobacteria bacterium]
MADRLSVTELKCAVLDQEFRRRLIDGERPAIPWCVPSNGGPPVKGALFHKLADAFTRWLSSAGPQGLDLVTADDLWHALYDRFAEADLTELAETGQLESALHISLCLRTFCTRLASLRGSIQGFAGWQDLFLGMELPIEGVVIADTDFAVSGRVDAVRADTKHGVVVVDYKLSRGSQTKHDLLQLAIYAHLLEAIRPGLSFAGLLEYYDPELCCIEVDPDDLRALFRDVVMPVLREMTDTRRAAEARRTGIAAHPGDGKAASPQQRGAAGDRAADEATDGSAETAQAETTHADTARADEEPDLSTLIVETFADFRLDVQVVGRVKAPQLVRYKVRPARGVKVVSLANRSEDLQVRLTLPSPPRIGPCEGYVSVDIPKRCPRTVYWSDIRSASRSEHGSVVFPIGVGVEGDVLFADFADPNTCHAIVAGTSGSGKSEFLKSMCASLLARNRPDTLRLTLVDPKILTFGALSRFPHVSGPVISDVDEAIECLERAVAEMEARYRQLADEGFTNLAERMCAGRADLPFHVIVFDEFADLVLAGKQHKATFESFVARLAAKGRAAGIHLVLATQRPDRTIVTGIIKANLPLKVCLKVTSAVNSQIILDEAGAETLVGKGDLLCDRGRGVERAQSPFVRPDDLDALYAEAARFADRATA